MVLNLNSKPDEVMSTYVPWVSRVLCSELQTTIINTPVYLLIIIY